MNYLPSCISLYFLAALIGWFALPATLARAETPRPNILIILMDDLGQRDLGCYGSKYYRTPHLDRLARDGMRFTDAYAACPVCSPSRAALLTGKYPARLNLTDWLPGRPDRPDQKLLRPIIQQHLPLEETTIAEALHAAGYATGHIGKWHLGGEGFGPRQQGFDVNIGGNQGGSPPTYFAPFKNPQGTFLPGLEQAPDGEYLTDRLTSEAEKFIEQNRQRPFFLYLAHYAVHIPLQARPADVARYGKGGKAGEQSNPLYAAMVESMDNSVGRLVKKLEDLQLTKQTMILFTSDNGGLSVLEGPNTPATINAPLREGKGYLYEGGIRVPLLIKQPGVIRPEQVCQTPVSCMDFFPTLLAVCGATSSAQVDGVNLAPLLHGRGALAREALYWHYPHYSNQGGRPGGAIRAGDYKLIEFEEQGRRELYDLKRDPGENNNLIEDRPEIARALAGKLEAWRREVGARRMRPNPDYVPNPQGADGIVNLPARTAEVHGVQLRYEPLPHKNTLGFWTRKDDWTSWDFQLTRSGAFRVELLQGCGAGQGGSEVEAQVGEQKLTMTVEDTGHFQNFKSRTIGTIQLDKPGRYTLAVKARSKRGVAVMDLRAVRLIPAQ
jgi:arylsulfatase A-like enzyme